MGQSISSVQFYLYGKRHCTRDGWLRASASYPKPDYLTTDFSLNGKVYMVTGANAGIGYTVCEYLAKKQATIYMICRNAERGHSKCEELKMISGNSNIFPLIYDCGLREHMHKAWNEFISHRREHSLPERLDCLVCNAGALSDKITFSAENIETTFATHLLFGTYLLTKLALPTLKATPESRVVVVSSGGMYNTSFPKIEKASGECFRSDATRDQFDGQFAYCYSKRGQVLLCEKLTELHKDCVFVSCHPGWCDTVGVDTVYGEKKSYLQPLRSLWEGSEGIIWLCVAPANQLKSGEFYLDRTPRTKHIGGPFFSEGSFTKNTPEEVNEMMKHLEDLAEKK